jgi:hypothetical protein
MVEKGSQWTVLDTAGRKVRFGAPGESWDYDALAARPQLKARADRLVAAWETERWARHRASN